MKRPQVIADVVVVLTLAASGLIQLWSTDAGSLQGGRHVHAVLLLASTVPLLARRRHAILVFVTIVAASWIQFKLGGGLGQPFFAGVLALYSVGAHAGAPQTFLGPASIALQAVAIDIPRLRDGAPPDEVLPAWFILVGVWAFGRWMRHRQAHAAILVQRTEAAEKEAIDQAERADQAVQQERARIAHELHDLVAHSMGIIVIQAQGAQRVLTENPTRALSALSAIEATGRNGLAEMRRLLDLLGPEPKDHAALGGGTTEPQPSLSGLDDLVDRVRRTGLDVELDVDGAVRELAPGLELCGYRVVQEALTNALKHAGPSSVRVNVTYEPDFVDISVADDGAGQGDRIPATSRTGHGLVGMRERVDLYGGSLAAGPGPEGGYSIHVRLPLTPESS